MKAKVLILVAGLAAGGCASVPPPVPLSKSVVKNDLGHVVGIREVSATPDGRAVTSRVSFFTPIYGKSGAILGYEEANGDGSYIRDLEGHMIGRRFSDQRSRMTNPVGRGYTIIVRSRPLEQPYEGEQVSALTRAD